MVAYLCLVLVLSFAVLLGFITPTLRKLYKRTSFSDVSPDWLERFSPESYYPMEQLLAREDFTFLSRQPGFDLSLYRKLRRDRLQIFRHYLYRMIGDFNRLHQVARLVLAQSSDDHSEVLLKLLRLKLRFSGAMLLAEIRYGLCCLGVRTLSARMLIMQLEELNAQVAALSPHPA